MIPFAELGTPRPVHEDPKRCSTCNGKVLEDEVPLEIDIAIGTRHFHFCYHSTERCDRKAWKFLAKQRQQREAEHANG